MSFANVRSRNVGGRHIETQKQKNNERIKRKEEEKLSKMTDEEKDDEYDKIKKLKKIWNKVRL